MLGPAHGYVGALVAGIFLLLGIWGIVGWARNRHPGGWFWRLLAIAQGGLGLQVILGGVLLAMGGRREWLHYAYGFFPILVLIFVHRFSRRLEGIEWVAFAFAGLVNFGLLLRGYMTGVGG
ncbi:MAG: hypothetical protein ACRDI1_00205 [Actinomycetota bacterium]